MVGRIEGDRYKKILEAEYKKANLEKEILENFPQLHPKRQKKLLQLLKRFKLLFDGILGTWKGVKYDIGLQPVAIPYHGKPYTTPHAYKK